MGNSDDYIGYATAPDQAFADATAAAVTYDNTLAMNSAEDRMYIGWNVYGSSANPNDIKLLSNAIIYMTGGTIGSVSVPLFGPLGYALIASLFGLFGFRRLKQG